MIRISSRCGPTSLSAPSQVLAPGPAERFAELPGVRPLVDKAELVVSSGEAAECRRRRVARSSARKASRARTSCPAGLTKLLVPDVEGREHVR